MAAVAIVDYDPTWPGQFEELAAALWRHLDDGVLAIDHIGSTAVPGLAAKDVIDLQVTVADLAQADRLAPAATTCGPGRPRRPPTRGSRATWPSGSAATWPPTPR